MEYVFGNAMGERLVVQPPSGFWRLMPNGNPARETLTEVSPAAPSAPQPGKLSVEEAWKKGVCQECGKVLALTFIPKNGRYVCPDCLDREQAAASRILVEPSGAEVQQAARSAEQAAAAADSAAESDLLTASRAASERKEPSVRRFRDKKTLAVFELTQRMGGWENRDGNTFRGSEVERLKVQGRWEEITGKPEPSAESEPQEEENESPSIHIERLSKQVGRYMERFDKAVQLCAEERRKNGELKQQIAQCKESHERTLSQLKDLRLKTASAKWIASSPTGQGKEIADLKQQSAADRDIAVAEHEARKDAEHMAHERWQEIERLRAERDNVQEWISQLPKVKWSAGDDADVMVKAVVIRGLQKAGTPDQFSSGSPPVAGPDAIASKLLHEEVDLAYKARDDAHAKLAERDAAIVAICEIVAKLPDGTYPYGNIYEPAFRELHEATKPHSARAHEIAERLAKAEAAAARGERIEAAVTESVNHYDSIQTVIRLMADGKTHRGDFTHVACIDRHRRLTAVLAPAESREEPVPASDR